MPVGVGERSEAELLVETMGVLREQQPAAEPLDSWSRNRMWASIHRYWSTSPEAA